MHYSLLIFMVIIKVRYMIGRYMIGVTALNDVMYLVV